MRVTGILFLLAACLAAQDKNNPRNMSAQDQNYPRVYRYPPPDDRHKTPDPAPTEPHGAHPGHDMGNVAIGSGTGLLVGILMGHAMSGSSGSGGNPPAPEKMLSEQGPQAAPNFSMSDLSIVAFCKGGWPMVLDYEIRQPGLYLVTVAAESTPPYSYILDGTQTGRHQLILQIPTRFGTQTRVGTYTVQAINGQPGEVTPLYLRVFGIGAGSRAVGSVAIDQLRFSPPDLRPQDRQNAIYGFHSHADFERVTAEFERVGLLNGSIVTELEDKQDLKDAVRRDTTVDNKQWDPRKAGAKPGQHMLQVRAWYTLKSGGDWVMAWSPQLVRVEE
jgi:hypothetical protein